MPGFCREGVLTLDCSEEVARVGAHCLDGAGDGLERRRREGHLHARAGIQHPLGDEEGQRVGVSHHPVVARGRLLDDLATDAPPELRDLRRRRGMSR